MSDSLAIHAEEILTLPASEAAMLLREREEQLRLAIESTGLGMWDYDLVSGAMIWSDRCKAIFGLPPEATMTYEIFLSRLHPDDREPTNEVVQRALDPHGTGEYATEYRAVWPDETVRWIVAKGRAFFQGAGGDRKAVRFTGTIFDTTERKRAETELRASEQRYRALTDAMPQLVWATDENGAHTYFNRGWYEFTGMSEAESLGFGFANALHPDDKERTLERWKRAWSAGEAYEIEYRFYSRPLGAYRWFLGRAQPVRDSNANRVTQWVGTCTDIEVQKRMEEELARVGHEREQMLTEVLTPIVPIWRGVLVVPIIGSLDTERMQRTQEATLQEVARTGAHACIIDITAARIVDSHAVANLSNLVRALKLVGAEGIVTGVTAHAAQSLVGLGLDFAGMRTHRTLAEALAVLIKNQQINSQGLLTSNGITQNSR